MRPIAVALVVLCSAAHSQADMVTGYAQGTVTRDYYQRDPPANPYDFTLGEAIFLTFTYDLDPGPPLPIFAFEDRIAVEMDSQYGFHKAFSSSVNSMSSGSDDGTNLRLRLSFDPITFELSLPWDGSAGRLFYSRDGGGGGEGFEATVYRVADDGGFPGSIPAVPEPSSLLTCGVGTLLALGYAWRRRRAA